MPLLKSVVQLLCLETIACSVAVKRSGSDTQPGSLTVRLTLGMHRIMEQDSQPGLISSWACDMPTLHWEDFQV